MAEISAPRGADADEAYPAFLECLDGADEAAATGLAHDLLAAGVDAESVLLDVVAPAMAQVGRWWQDNAWSVAQEHAAAYLSERVIAVIGARAAPDPWRERVVVACAQGEWHALPARIVAETLRLRGWRTSFVGADVPVAHLVSYLRRHDPYAVALSCSISARLPQAHQAILACRRIEVPLLAGGRGFGARGRWARRLGAPWAADARSAAAALDRLPSRHPPGDTPAHLADDEYAPLLRRRAELIEAGAEALYGFPPPTDTPLLPGARLQAGTTPRAGTRPGAGTAPRAGSGAAWPEHVIADLGLIVDHLAAAVYVDDAALFTGFATWLADLVGARGVSAATPDLALARQADLLYDFPRSRRFLDRGRTALRAHRATAPADTP